MKWKHSYKIQVLTGHKKKYKKQSRKETLDNAHKHYKGRKMIIDAFENGFFPLSKRPPSFQGQDEDKDKEFISQEERAKYTGNEFNKLIVEKEKSINKELSTKHINFRV